MKKPIPRLPDGSVDTSADLSSHFDDVLDSLHSTFAQPTHEPTAEEKEARQRAESGYWDSIRKEVGNRLALTGIQAVGFQEPPEEHKEQFEKELILLDGHGREYHVLIPASLVRGPYGLIDDSMRLPNVNLIVRSVLSAADEYRKQELRGGRH